MSRSLHRLALAAAAVLVLPTGPVVATQSAGAVLVPTVVAVRAAHHPGYDRFVLEMSGGLPGTVRTAWKSRIASPQTDRTIPLAGNAFLELHLTQAQGHTNAGVTTVPRAMTFALPNITQLAVAEDFEAHLVIGFGVQRRAAVHVFRMTHPSRVVLDLATPFTTVPVRDYFLNQPNYAVGRSPDMTAVTRPVIPPAVARGALKRLFAGPTAAEKAAGLRFVSSGATGFRSLTIAGGIARVRLAGVCNSRGATFTVANEIMPTLKQFPSIRWVKIYDAAGTTERPTGPSDSIPICLEP